MPQALSCIVCLVRTDEFYLSVLYPISLGWPKKCHFYKKLKEGFTVSISRGIGPAIAFDEASEICVNRDMKMSILILNFTNVSFRIIAHKNLLCQLFPQLSSGFEVLLIFSFSTASDQWSWMRSDHRQIRSSCLLQALQLIMVYSMFSQAFQQQRHDLLGCWQSWFAGILAVMICWDIGSHDLLGYWQSWFAGILAVMICWDIGSHDCWDIGSHDCWDIGSHDLLGYWQSWFAGILAVMICWDIGSHDLLGYWQSWFAGILAVMICWDIGSHDLLGYWQSWFAGILAVMICWDIGSHDLLGYWQSWFAGILAVMICWDIGRHDLLGYWEYKA